jgi:Bifunctional DNA primase/polymerase, N-terminal
MSPDPNLLEAALAFAARGWQVFPCIPAGKRPVTPRGFHDGSTNPATVRRSGLSISTTNSPDSGPVQIPML